MPLITDTIIKKGTATVQKIYKGGTQVYPQIDYSEEYFTITSLEDGNVVTFNISSELTTSMATSISWSKDKRNWTETLVDGTQKTIDVNLDEGESVYFKGVATTWAVSHPTSNVIITSTKTFEAKGNIMSLLYGDDFSDETTITGDSAFDILFAGGKIVNAQNLILPATTLSTACYKYMFHRCNLLVSAPELPAITLASECYSLMFYGCTSLVSAPVLPATTLASSCYAFMFQGCTNLSYVKCLATDISAPECTFGWVDNVSSEGTFVKASGMYYWTRSADGIPSGWTVEEE